MRFQTVTLVLLVSLVFTATGLLAVHNMDAAIRAAYNGEGYTVLADLIAAVSPQPLQKMTSNDYVSCAKRFFTGLVILALATVSLFLFFRTWDQPRCADQEHPYRLAAIALIVLNGTLIRLMLAFMLYGNFDMESWEISADIALRNGNVYMETYRHNYSPLWYWVIGALKHLQLRLATVPFHFVLRSFLTLVDLATLVLLMGIARRERLDSYRVALLFYLNPVSFIITGYHGQMENLATLPVIAGIYCALLLPSRSVLSGITLWGFSTLGFVIKHSLLEQVAACVGHGFKRLSVRVLLIGMSFVVFGLSFLPYLPEGQEGILKNVIFYSAIGNSYGITSLLQGRFLKPMFVAGCLLFPLLLKEEDLIERCLLSSLFFLVFTTGIGQQYFVLPLAFAALRPSKAFLIYSGVAVLFILGRPENMELPVLRGIQWNVVWIAVCYWFVAELYEVRMSLTRRTGSA